MLRARQARRARGNGGTGSAGSGADLDLFFSNSTYTVSGGNYTTLGSIPGFTFTRASLAMGYDATGKLTYGPNNLLLQSQTFGTTWTATQVTVGSNVIAAPDGTTTADSLIATAVSSQHRADQAPSSPAGPQVFSVYAKAGAYNYVGLRIGTVGAGFDLTTGATSSVTGGVTATATSVGNGWWRCAIHYATAAANDICRANIADGSSFAPTFTGDGVSAGIYLWGAQLEAVTYQTTPSTYYPTTTAAYYGPRLVYDPVTLASQGILVEEARTNSVVQSQDFSTSWTLSRATVSVNATTSPAGTSNADKLVEDATAANTHRAVGAVTTTAVPWTFSVYAKADTRTWIYLRVDRSDTTTPFTWFNLGAGAVGTVGTGITASIRSVGNGWYRCVVTVDAALAAPSQPIIGLSTGDGVSSYSGDGTSGLYVWQAQYELGTGASSPIPTTTASVTRAADVAAVTGLNMPYPLSVVAAFQRNIDNAIQQTIAQLDTGAPANRFNLYVGASDLLTSTGRGGANGGDAAVSGATATEVTYAGAARALQNDFIAARGGTLSTPDTTFDYPASAARLSIGNADSGFQLNGTISRIRIYNRALSDAELQAITQSLLLQEDGYSILQEDNSYIWLE